MECIEKTDLKWNTLKEKTILQTPVFNVDQKTMQAANGYKGDYVAIKAPDWVVVVPVYKDQFVLVRQWRHGYGEVTTEFPAGLAEKGEKAEDCAYRELLEETGYKAGKVTVLGTCSPNPALFANRMTVCLAEDLVPTGQTHPDEDEIITAMTVPIPDVIDSFCSGEYVHAYMGTALALYMRNNTNRKSHTYKS